MHNEYSISSLSDCYTKVKQWISTIRVFTPVLLDIDFASTVSAVKGVKMADFDDFIANNNYRFGMLDGGVPASRTYNSEQVINITYSVYKNIPNEYYLVIACDQINSRIYFTTCDSYKSVYSCFEQEHSCYAKIVNGYKSDMTGNSNSSKYCDVHMARYTAVACLLVESENSELHCTYNNNCIALSTIDVTDMTRHTYNVFVGMLRKHRHYNGGNYFAGNACAYIEIIDSFACTTVRVPITKSRYVRIAHFTYISSSIHLVEDVGYANVAWHIGNNASFILDPSTLENNNASRPRKYYFNCFDIFVRLDLDNYVTQSMFWASNVAFELNNSKFIFLCSTYSDKEIELPTYRHIISNSVVDPGRAINQLNGISMVLPTDIMVKRQPVVLNNYSSIGYMDYVSYVSMYNCSSGSINDIEWPSEEDAGQYECLSIYRRRMTTSFIDLLSWERIRPGFSGYNGFAVRQSSKEIQLIDWFILAELRLNYQPREIINSDTGIKAYKGTLEFDNIKTYYKDKLTYSIGYLPLIFSFTYFDYLRIEYTTDEGNTKKEYICDVISLKEAIDAGVPYNLLGDSSDVITMEINYDYPEKYCQLSILDSHDIGIIAIVGY